MVDAKKIVIATGAVIAGLKLLYGMRGESSGSVFYDLPTSFHDLIIDEQLPAGVPNVSKRIISLADQAHIGEQIPISLAVTNAERKIIHKNIPISHQHCDYDLFEVTLKYSPVESLILLACVESSCGRDINMEQVDAEHWRATADDVGPFHINRRVWNEWNWDRFTVNEYVDRTKQIISRQMDSVQDALVLLFEWRRNGILPSDISRMLLDGVNPGNDVEKAEFSKYLSLAIYNRAWNRIASPANREGRNFLRKFDINLTARRTLQVRVSLGHHCYY